MLSVLLLISFLPHSSSHPSLSPFPSLNPPLSLFTCPLLSPYHISPHPHLITSHHTLTLSHLTTPSPYHISHTLTLSHLTTPSPYHISHTLPPHPSSSPSHPHQDGEYRVEVPRPICNIVDGNKNVGGARSPAYTTTVNKVTLHTCIFQVSLLNAKLLLPIKNY